MKVSSSGETRLFWAMLLTGGFMLAEVVGGIMSGSLALLADAGHMLSDTAALGLAFAASRVIHRPPDAQRSYGYHRAQVLSAFVNGLTLLAIAAWIIIEAVQRFLQPIEVMGGLMLTVAVLGLGVNIAAFWVLHGGDRENINLKGALLHVLGDLLGSVAAIVAAIVILWTGWFPIDPLLSILVALLIIYTGWSLVRQSAHILLEGTPTNIDVEELRTVLAREIPAIRDVHHVHAWSLAPGQPLLTMHVAVAPGNENGEVLQRIKGLLRERFAILHATVQLEDTKTCRDDPCGNTAFGPDAGLHAGHDHSAHSHSHPH